MQDEPFDLARHPVHLGLGARVVRLPVFDGEMSWYEDYGRAHAADGREGRLVTMHSFERSWETWEMHPNGEELVLCLSGRITLHQEVEGTTRRVTLEPGWAIVNPPGVWHTADVEATATALFVTAGEGTQIRPR